MKNTIPQFLKGADLSTLPEVEAHGGKFYDKGIEKDPLIILKEHDFNSVRLRLWNHPYSKDGKPYGAGNNDLDTTMKLIKRCKKSGFHILLDFQYSDFWADPGKQFKPKAWQSHGVEELKEDVYNYTKEVLCKLKEEDSFPDFIQVGNELSNGLLWPEGKVPNYDNIAAFVNAGIRGVRAIDTKVPIMIHLDNGGNQALYKEWFDEFLKRGEDFQVIGLSYYPFWHGTLQMLYDNMQQLVARYGKELIVAEVSMGFTMEDYAIYEKLEPSQRKGYATKPSLVEKLEHPMTKEGQSQFMRDFFQTIQKVDQKAVKGFYYWEPAWIPVEGSGWATEESLEYIKDPGPCGNEWANQALFDYDGNVNEAMEVIKRFENI